MMKSTDLTVRDALYLYTICSILPDSSDSLPYKESLFLWFCIEPPRHAWRRPAIQQIMEHAFVSLNFKIRSFIAIGINVVRLTRKSGMRFISKGCGQLKYVQCLRYF
jgi:hypothetical protein